MFVTKKAEDDVIKLRSALSDVKFLAQQALMEKSLSEKMRVFFDDIIKIADLGMYEEPKNSLDRAKEKINNEKCCGEK
tara:strand:+ start:211 stop:444 length:234 start_codon:yes stop_codon:yes gene_type:complete